MIHPSIQSCINSMAVTAGLSPPLEAGKLMHAGESSLRTAPPEQEDCLAGKVVWGNGQGEKFQTRIGMSINVCIKQRSAYLDR
jgi:hypothetical protein